MTRGSYVSDYEPQGDRHGLAEGEYPTLRNIPKNNILDNIPIDFTLSKAHPKLSSSSKP